MYSSMTNSASGICAPSSDWMSHATKGSEVRGRLDGPELVGAGHVAVHAVEAVPPPAVGGQSLGKGKACQNGGRRTTTYIPEDLGFEVDPKHDAILAGVQSSLP